MKLLATFLVVAFASAAQAQDNRASIEVTEAQQQMILEEMRDYVAALQEIAGGLAREDYDAVAQAAHRMGRSRMTGERMQMARQLPDHFRMMGMSVHDDFDAIARDIVEIQDKDHALEQISSALGKCVGCHAGFRLELK